MKIIDKFPMKGRGTGIVIDGDGDRPVAGHRLRRTADGREWRIDAVESTISNGSVALCIVGDPPSVGDDVMICEQ
jgi:hypothetical protein